MKSTTKHSSSLVTEIFIVWRLALFILAGIAGYLMSFTPRFPYADILLIPSKLPYWIWSFANFDGVHYLNIVKTGYSAQFTQVFFPLYPLAIRLLNTIFPFISPIISGLIISNLCFLIALGMVYKLVLIDFEKRTALMTIFFIVTFPTSFFFGSLYTESLFFMLTVGSFLAARRGHWLLAGILGGFASATRLHGIFLLPALLWERWESVDKKHFAAKDVLFWLISPVLFVASGIAAYMIYLHVTFGDALYFWHAQPAFGAERSGNSIILLPQVIWRYIKILWTNPPVNESFWIPAAEMFFTLFCIGVLVIAHKYKIRTSYLIFSWIAVIVPTLTGTFSSMPRYVLVAFPMYIVLAKLPNKILQYIILSIFTLLLIVFTIIFTRGHWVS